MYNDYVQAKITKDKVTPFYAEVIGEIAEYKHSSFIDLIVAYKRKHPDYEQKQAYLYVGKLKWE